MDYLQIVQRGVDFIEERLDSDVQIAHVARHAGISQWHFQRIFKGLTNETLKTYIRSRRLAWALQQLLTTNVRLIEIALGAGFETQESFTRAFKKAFGMTPGRVRSLGGGAKFLTKVRFDAEYLRHIHTHISLEPEIFPQAKLRLIGMRTRFFGIVSDKNNMGRKLPGLWQQFLPRMHEATDRIGDVGYGVIQQTPACTDELEYYAAVEIRRFGRTPRGMVALTVPAACYAQFAHRGLVQNLDHTVNYI